MRRAAGARRVKGATTGRMPEAQRRDRARMAAAQQRPLTRRATKGSVPRYGDGGSVQLMARRSVKSAAARPWEGSRDAAGDEVAGARSAQRRRRGSVSRPKGGEDRARRAETRAAGLRSRRARPRPSAGETPRRIHRRKPLPHLSTCTSLHDAVSYLELLGFCGDYWAGAGGTIRAVSRASTMPSRWLARITISCASSGLRMSTSRWL